MNTALRYPCTNSSDERNSLSNNQNKEAQVQRFKIYTLEWAEAEQLFIDDEAEKIANFEFLWIKNGRGQLQVDGQSHVLTNNFLYCIFPGSMRKINLEQGVDGYYFSFAVEFLKLSDGYSNNSTWLEQYDSYTNVLSTNVEKEKEPEFEIITIKMLNEYNNYFNRRLELLKGLLNIFLIYFSRSLNEIPVANIPNREKDLVNKFISLMKKNFLSKKLVNDYASLLCVTPNYLNRTIKKITGFTASHHIQQQIILEAKRQAMYSSVSMKQIAYGLGFDNLAHFSKFFKTNSGMSFTDFKRNALLTN